MKAFLIRVGVLASAERRAMTPTERLQHDWPVLLVGVLAAIVGRRVLESSGWIAALGVALALATLAALITALWRKRKGT